MKYISILLVLIFISGCTWLSSDSKIKVTDPNGNSITISEDGADLVIKSLEKDGYSIEKVE